jgi:hypothetical protein
MYFGTSNFLLLTQHRACPFSRRNLSNAEEKIARPVLLWHDDTGVGARILWIVNDPVRSVVVSVVQKLGSQARRWEGGKGG